MVYGWIGGMAYIMLLLATLWIGLRTVLVRTPWQPYLISAFAAFVGEVLEGFVIDTDHWRHFFLLLGMIWGLAAATLKRTRQPRCRMPAGRLPMSALESVPRRTPAGAAQRLAPAVAAPAAEHAHPDSERHQPHRSRRCPTPTRPAACRSPSPACSRPRAASAKARAWLMPRSTPPAMRPPPSI